ncbi:MAG: hypothetical protein K9J16_03705 [Melioribacteraceae bacterium]|nr:hypothetical protein [Melioribacteraceae bacterium]MCF8356178.1 hypothetical protein [Melioribacteraceae bacterium]MCF8394749.1 hypothetical protein [Melioribacteraceae bacterium]MCF8417951.1 hypothetical protein [Melioribacteraceae bacterium]
MEKYIKAIRDNICAICVDSEEETGCTLNEKETCAVELYLPEILEIVHNTDSEYMDDYYKKLKNTICVNCRGKDNGENCYLREDANCSLDRYFSLIVETIKKVDAGKI